jgi:anaerobic selenocysteine-containing dehydrogenase
MSVETRSTTCPLDCPDGCALGVEVTNGRVTRIGPAPDSAHTGGFICAKVTGFARRLYHAERILHPLRRVGPKGRGGFERISWDEAIETIAGNLGAIAERWGGEAILPFHYGGSNGLITDEFIDHLFFSRLGASRLGKTICALPATEVAQGMYGKMPGVAFDDYPRARAIVVWGANPRGSNIHLAPHLREAKRRGAWIAQVDPRRTLASAEVDLHLPVLPGQDLPLALALIERWRTAGQLDLEFVAGHADGLEPLLERAAGWPLERAAAVCGVEAEAIAELADRLAGADPALVRCGWGPERNRNGAQAMAAILAIPALLGKFGVRGGGYTLSNSGAVRFDRDAVIGPLAWRTRKLNMSQLGRLLNDDLEPRLEPPIKALFVYNANPAATVPDQRQVLRGLAREDLFTVVHEQVMTDTARLADIVLPAVTFLEGHLEHAAVWPAGPGAGVRGRAVRPRRRRAAAPRDGGGDPAGPRGRPRADRRRRPADLRLRRRAARADGHQPAADPRRPDPPHPAGPRRRALPLAAARRRLAALPGQPGQGAHDQLHLWREQSAAADGHGAPRRGRHPRAGRRRPGAGA